jgi:hypothetical protein
MCDILLIYSNTLLEVRHQARADVDNAKLSGLRIYGELPGCSWPWPERNGTALFVLQSNECMFPFLAGTAIQLNKTFTMGDNKQHQSTKIQHQTAQCLRY